MDRFFLKGGVALGCLFDLLEWKISAMPAEGRFFSSRFKVPKGGTSKGFWDEAQKSLPGVPAVACCLDLISLAGLTLHPFCH